jgi:hypothetical protein
MAGKEGIKKKAFEIKILGSQTATPPTDCFGLTAAAAYSVASMSVDLRVAGAVDSRPADLRHDPQEIFQATPRLLGE